MCRLFIGADPKLWDSVTKSFRMDGMVTSVRLEHMFWNVLEEIAAREDVNVPQLLHRLYNESIDEGHDLGNFTSFLRVCCLRFFNLQLHNLVPTSATSELDMLPTDEILEIENKLNAAAGIRRSANSSQH
ncbi:ribbon-helix-helix domain-containing protein [Sedimentitalea sp. XS_ASV28]|uniref:ribbon-helix-helix domain-containing protein n=1 Tax=Sedimentitalea sp. XS_ASV28 TaxID=3241296 RepID=UPI003518E7D6